MNILVITSHPRPSGFTHRIASSYASKQKTLGNTVEILDLCLPENQQSYASFIDESHLVDDDTTRRMQEKITWANELIFVFPVWWMDAPAVMKNWIDRNFTSGFAFKYNPNGKVDKLLTGKTVKLFATAGGPGGIIGFFLGLIWKMGRFGFVGLKPTAFRVLGGFTKRTEEEKVQFLEKL